VTTGRGPATPSAPATIIRVRVQPRASRDEVVGWREDTLRVRVSAPPLDGRANDAVVVLVARAAGVGRSAVSVVSGERSRDKLVRVSGLTAASLRGRLGA
jgi:uncharacterized protein